MRSAAVNAQFEGFDKEGEHVFIVTVKREPAGSEVGICLRIRNTPMPAGKFSLLCSNWKISRLSHIPEAILITAIHGP